MSSGTILPVSAETKSDTAVISPPPKAPAKVGATMTAIYDALAIRWEKCPLVWNPTKASRNGLGAKDGIRQGLGAGQTDWNGWLIHLDGLLAIDIDGDDEGCRQLRTLCEAASTFVAKTRKGNHYIFNADPRIKNYNAKTSESEVDTKTGDSSILLVQPSRYETPSGVVEYRWTRIPDTREAITNITPEIFDWLATHGGYSTVLKPAGGAGIPPAPITPPADEPIADAAPTSSKFAEIAALCDCLTPDFLAECATWIRFLYMMKNLTKSNPSDAAAIKELFLNTSARATCYSTAAHRTQNARMWDSTEVKQTLSGIGTLKHFAKTCDPTKYFAIYRDDYWNLINLENNNGWVRIFYNAMGGDIVYSQSEKKYFIYNPTEFIWEPCEDYKVNFQFVERCQDIFRRLRGELPIASSEEEVEKRKAKEKKLTNAGNTCGGYLVKSLVKDWLPALCDADGKDPALFFNQNPNLLPLINGVWDFTEKRLIAYEREHYFTFKYDIAYNPDADTSLIQQAAMDWFQQNAEVAEFVKRWMGYSLTGFTTRQEFVIVWGSTAGNGKSLLWGEIASILHGHTPGKPTSHFASFNSDALSSERTGNNDQLYNLCDKRYAFLSEPRRGTKHKMDTEQVKTLTGDTYFTAEAKYKSSRTFPLRAKMVMACNDLPELSFEDEGLLRRVIVIPQNVRFVDRETYDAAPAALKESHQIKIRDDAFRDRLIENREGLLLWALQGASDYIDNPRFVVPEVIRAAKLRAATETDILGNWISSHIRPTTRPKASVRLAEIKPTITENIGQRDRGFEARFKEKAERLGFTVGGRLGKGELHIKGVEYSAVGFDLTEDDGLVVEM